MLSGKATQLSGVKVLDDYTLQVTIDAPKAYFLDKMAYPTAFVVDRTNVAIGQYLVAAPQRHRAVQAEAVAEGPASGVAAQ